MKILAATIVAIAMGLAVGFLAREFNAAAMGRANAVFEQVR